MGELKRGKNELYRKRGNDMIQEIEKHSFYRDVYVIDVDNEDEVYQVGDMRGFKYLIKKLYEKKFEEELSTNVGCTLYGESTKGYELEVDEVTDEHIYKALRSMGYIDNKYDIMYLSINNNDTDNKLTLGFTTEKRIVGDTPVQFGMSALGEPEEIEKELNKDFKVEKVVPEGEFYKTLVIEYGRLLEGINDIEIGYGIEAWNTYIKTEEDFRGLYPHLVRHFIKNNEITEEEFNNMEFNLGYRTSRESSLTYKDVDVHNVEEVIKELKNRGNKGITIKVKEERGDILKGTVFLESWGGLTHGISSIYEKEEVDGVRTIEEVRQYNKINVERNTEYLQRTDEEEVEKFLSGKASKLFRENNKVEPSNILLITKGYIERRTEEKISAVRGAVDSLEDLQQALDVVVEYYDKYLEEKSELSFVITTVKYAENAYDVMDLDTYKVHVTDNPDIESWGIQGLLEYMMTGDNEEYERDGVLGEVTDLVDEVRIYVRLKSTNLREQRQLDFRITDFSTLIQKHYEDIGEFPYEDEKKMSLLDLQKQEESIEEDAVGEVNEQEEELYEEVEYEEEEEFDTVGLKQVMVMGLYQEDTNEETEESYYTFEEVEQLVEDAFRRGYEQGLQEELQEEINVEIADESITHHLESDDS